MGRFDELINRKGTGSFKWDLYPEYDPYWVADMDFRSPDCVISALHSRVEHGVFGYACATEKFEHVLVEYMRNMHAVKIFSDWIIHMGGCVPTLAVVAMSCCGKGDSIMTCSPVYPPIRTLHESVGAEMIEVPHVYQNGVWTFDWEAMERSVLPTTKLFVLCNPQNPLGRVFSYDELLKLADFCERHDLLLCSDEIHCDLILDKGVRHTSILGLPEKYLERVIMLSAPSKTYNIAGIGYSMAVIPSQELRTRFEKWQHRCQPPVHCLAFASAEAAYEQGESWRRELIEYLRGNRDELYQFVQKEMPGIKMHPMQATYLAWMDCSGLGMPDPQRFFKEKFGVYLSSGAPFGEPLHVRFNFGTTRNNMLDGLQKMKEALCHLRK